MYLLSIKPDQALNNQYCCCEFVAIIRACNALAIKKLIQKMDSSHKLETELYVSFLHNV